MANKKKNVKKRNVKKQQERQAARTEKAKKKRRVPNEKAAQKERMSEEEYRNFAENQMVLNRSVLKKLEQAEKHIEALRSMVVVHDAATGVLADKLGLTVDDLAKACAEKVAEDQMASMEKGKHEMQQRQAFQREMAEKVRKAAQERQTAKEDPEVVSAEKVPEDGGGSAREAETEDGQPSLCTHGRKVGGFCPKCDGGTALAGKPFNTVLVSPRKASFTAVAETPEKAVATIGRLFRSKESTDGAPLFMLVEEQEGEWVGWEDLEGRVTRTGPTFDNPETAMASSGDEEDLELHPEEVEEILEEVLETEGSMEDDDLVSAAIREKLEEGTGEN